MFPIRCYTCNEVIAQKYGTYASRTCSEHAALDALDIRRLCCRRMFLSYVVQLADNELKYSNQDTVFAPGVTLYRKSVVQSDTACD